MGYEADCTRCKETIYKYVGESSRTTYTRAKEHISDYRAAAAAKLPALQTRCGTADHDQYGRRKDVKSFMWEHTRNEHEGQVGDKEGVLDYKFHLSNTFKRCLQRQVDEGLRIKMREGEGCVILNSKNEWFTPKLVEVEIRQQ